MHTSRFLLALLAIALAIGGTHILTATAYSEAAESTDATNLDGLVKPADTVSAAESDSNAGDENWLADGQPERLQGNQTPSVSVSWPSGYIWLCAAVAAAAAGLALLYSSSAGLHLLRVAACRFRDETPMTVGECASFIWACNSCEHFMGASRNRYGGQTLIIPVCGRQCGRNETIIEIPN